MSPESPSSGGAITRDEVAHLARLARLAVTDDELGVFAGQLDVILGAVARVGEVAADDIPPTSHSVPLENVFRPDELRPSLTQEQARGGPRGGGGARFRARQPRGGRRGAGARGRPPDSAPARRAARARGGGGEGRRPPPPLRRGAGREDPLA